MALALSTLLVTSAALAGPKRPRAPAPTPTYLTKVEQLCATFGEIALLLTRERERGVSRFTVLQWVRKNVYGPGRALAAEDLQRAGDLEAIVGLVYDYPALAPAQLQQATETVCLQTYSPTAQPPAQAQGGDRLRY